MYSLPTEDIIVYLKGAHPPFTSDIFYGFVKKLSSWIRSEDLMYNMMNVVDSDILYNWNLLGEYNLKILSQTSKKKKKKPKKKQKTQQQLTIM